MKIIYELIMKIKQWSSIKGRLQIVLGSSCKMYKSGEGEYPRFNPNKSVVAVHLEASDYYCEEF